MLQKKAAAIVENNEPDPALKFLQSIQKKHELTQIANELKPIRNEANSFIQHAEYISHRLSKKQDRFPPPSAEAYSVVTCPADGTQIRLADKSDELTAICPTCKYKFAINVEPPFFDKQDLKKPSLQTWRTRLAKLFGK